MEKMLSLIIILCLILAVMSHIYNGQLVWVRYRGEKKSRDHSFIFVHYCDTLCQVFTQFLMLPTTLIQDNPMNTPPLENSDTILTNNIYSKI